MQPQQRGTGGGDGRRGTGGGGRAAGAGTCGALLCDRAEELIGYGDLDAELGSHLRALGGRAALLLGHGGSLGGSARLGSEESPQLVSGWSQGGLGGAKQFGETDGAREERHDFVARA